MFSHAFIGTNDFERTFAFYAVVMSQLGHELRFCDRTRPWAGWQEQGRSRPLLLIGAPFDGRPAAPGNGQMIALAAATHGAVDAVYRLALANGGSSEGAPGIRPEYHPRYYGAYLRDPDGNKLCVVCHDFP